jgi:hypothetical protein
VASINFSHDLASAMAQIVAGTRWCAEVGEAVLTEMLMRYYGLK